MTSRTTSFAVGLIAVALVAYAVLGQDERDRICRRGFAASIRPPYEVTEQIKKEMMRAQGIPMSEIRYYRLDHIIPLELAGPPLEPANLQLQIVTDAAIKDHLEDQTRRDYCAGRITLPEARGRFVKIRGDLVP